MESLLMGGMSDEGWDRVSEAMSDVESAARSAVVPEALLDRESGVELAGD